MNIEETHQWNLPLGAAGEKRRHTVIIALADRVELVIVATRACHGKTEKRRSHRINGVGLPFRAELVAVISELDRKGAERKQTGADSTGDVFFLLLREL